MKTFDVLSGLNYLLFFTIKSFSCIVGKHHSFRGVNADWNNCSPPLTFYRDRLKCKLFDQSKRKY